MSVVANSATEKIPGRRWRLPAVLMVSVLVAYLDRMNISYAIPMIARDYGWSVSEVGRYGGALMSIFYIGYGLANIFLSPLGERFGPRKSLMAIVVLFSIFAALQSLAGTIFSLFLFFRMLLGLGEGIHFPMMNMVTKRWFPLHERSRANGIYVVGIFLAMVLAPFVVVPMVQVIGWRWMFVAIGLGGIVITLPLVAVFIRDTPESDPGLAQAEKEYILAGMETEAPTAEGLLKGMGAFAGRPVYWVAILGGVLNNMVAFGLLNWMPTYFTEGRGLAFSSLAYATAIPYLFSIFGVGLWAWLGDRTNRRGYLTGGCYLAAGVCAYFAATAPTITVTVALFALTVFINTAYSANEFAIIQRVVPCSRVASGVGLYNGLAMMVGGGLGPVMVGGVVSATGSYTAGLLSLTGLCALAGGVMFILGKMMKY